MEKNKSSEDAVWQFETHLVKLEFCTWHGRGEVLNKC